MFKISLTASLFFGALAGYLAPEFCVYLKPLGDLFLNLILTAAIPLIFFSIASVVANNSNSRLNKIFISIAIVFLLCSLWAAVEALLVMVSFSSFIETNFILNTIYENTNSNSGLIEDRNPLININLINLLSVKKFTDLFSHEHILALILFSILVGYASRKTDFCKFLTTGNLVTTRLLQIILYFSPIGFFSYFAVLIQSIGKQFISLYIGIALMYYIFSVFYFITTYSSYAYVASGKQGIIKFWKNISGSLSVSMATCSSVASIPSNLQIAKLIGVERDIYQTCIPIGAIIHKQGSIIGSVFKIMFLFKVYNYNFSSLNIWLITILISVLTGIIIGAFPGGGMLGEVFIVSVYGFDPSALLSITAISILIDPAATMLNVSGNITTAMLVERVRNCIDRFVSK